MKKITDVKEYLSKIKNGALIFDFLKRINFKTQEKSYDFGDGSYVNVFSCTTKQVFDEIFENHILYKDVHILIEGKEKIYYGEKKVMNVIKEYDKNEDYELLKGSIYSDVEYSSMQGVELDAGEPHAAGNAVNATRQILKAVIKLKKD